MGSELESNPEVPELLRLIWQEIKALGTNLGGRIDQTNERLDETNDRLEAVRIELKEEIDELRGAVVSSEIHVASELVAVSGQLRGLVEQMKSNQVEAKRIGTCELEINQLKSRVSSLESSRRQPGGVALTGSPGSRPPPRP